MVVGPFYVLHSYPAISLPLQEYTLETQQPVFFKKTGFFTLGGCASPVLESQRDTSGMWR
jgi:hypothetical protein